jgi:PPOX class probable F420-dependent enzyme
VRTKLDLADLGTLLEEPLLAVLATLRRDGSVLLSPVWHEWRDDGFNVWSGADEVKVRHLSRDPRVTIVVAEAAGVLRGIEIRGVAELIADPEVAGAAARRIAARYLGDVEGPEYVDSIGGDDAVIIRVAPGIVRAWDFADER